MPSPRGTADATIGELVERYLEWRQLRRFSDSTLFKDRFALQRFAWWCQAVRLERAEEVTVGKLEEYRRLLVQPARGAQSFTARSQGKQLQALRTFVRWLFKERHAFYDAGADLELPPRPDELPRSVLSPAEVERVLAQPDVATLQGLRDRAVMEVLYSTGLRRMELLRLAFGDLDMGKGLVLVRQGKGGGARVVPIGDRALSWVRRYLEEARPTLIEASGQRDEDAVFLFPDWPKAPLTYLTTMVRGYRRQTGITKKGSCHLFRHAMATHMLEGGADVRYVQEMLGHKQITTTQIYTRVSITKLREVHAAAHPAASSFPQPPADVLSPPPAPRRLASLSGTSELAELAHAYLENARRQRRSDSTLGQHRRALARFLGRCAGKGVAAPEGIAAQLLEEHARELEGALDGRGRLLSRGGQAAELGVVRAFVRWLAEHREVAAALPHAVKLPRAELPRILTEAETERLLEQPDCERRYRGRRYGLRDRALMQVILATAMGREQLLALGREDVDERGRALRWRTGERERWLALAEKPWWRVHAYVAGEWPLHAHAGDRLFVMSPDEASARVNDYLVKAGIPRGGGSELLRHTAAVRMLERGVSELEVRELLGTRLRTMRRYLVLAGRVPAPGVRTPTGGEDARKAVR